MSYNDLSTIKKINGTPADLRYFEQITQNDIYFKNEVDTDEDLSAIDRNIIPQSNSQYNIGSSLLRFKDLYTNHLFSNFLTLPTGTILNPAIKIGNLSLASLASNQLSFIAGGLESIRLMTSGLAIRAANSAQFKIENTSPGSLSEWAIGVDSTGLNFTDLSSFTESLKLSVDSLLTSRVGLNNGSALAPSFTFKEDLATGFYKDSSFPRINFAISGVDTLALSTEGLNLLMGSLVLPVGTASQPSLTFSASPGLGLLALDPSRVGIAIDGQPIHSFSKEGYTSTVEGASFTNKIAYSEVGLPSWHIDLVARANGVESLPLPLDDEDVIHLQAADGYTDAGWQRVSEIKVETTENYSTGSYGSSITFSTVPTGETELSQMLFLGSKKASVHIPMSLGLDKVEVAAPGLNQEIDVSNISKLSIDATLGNIGIKGFVGGKEGQMLYIYKKVPTNSFTLVFNSVTASQKVLLKGSADFVNTGDYGGITLSYDDGFWREVSRS